MSEIAQPASPEPSTGTTTVELPGCDLVMKGGITSGVVYPPAVAELARKYRFRSIGGTSAGAIAAAVTAAAEYNRAGGGFDRLHEVSDQLSTRSFLLNLFQPSRRTRPLMRTLLDLTAAQKGESSKAKGPQNFAMLTAKVLPRLTIALLRHDLLPFLYGAAIGVAVAIVLAWGTLALLPGPAPLLAWVSRGGFVVLILAAVVGGIVGGVIHLIKVLLREVPANHFGMCVGRSDPLPEAGPGTAKALAPALTDWLHETINRCAGLPADGPPLTYGQLKERSVELAMMTTNLSHGRPYLLPIETRIFLFKKEEMEKFFPGPVVAHLAAKAYKSKRSEPPAGYCYLPLPEDQPVILGARMSLSFPVLISAVPLYTVKATAFEGRKAGEKLQLTEQDLQRNVFSDGGISSNFPIHFFDAWLPSRPTFGINLADMPEEAARPRDSALAAGPRKFSSEFSSAVSQKAEAGDAMTDEEITTERDVYLPRPNEYIAPEWSSMADLPTFLTKILQTARGYHDNTQSVLPSYRERIVHVRFAPSEGGLNLAMDAKTIDGIKDRGKRAGIALRDRFNFEHHQWVRFRVLMAQLEVHLAKMRKALAEDETSFRRFLDAGRLAADPAFPYPQDENWCEKALVAVEQLSKLAEAWHPGNLFDPDSPRPRPVLRVVPNM